MSCVCPLVTCSVFEVLRSEARVMEGLRSLLIETPYIHDILKLNVQPSDSDYAVDIRNPAICVRTRTDMRDVKMLQKMRENGRKIYVVHASQVQSFFKKKEKVNLLLNYNPGFHLPAVESSYFVPLPLSIAFLIFLSHF